MKKRRREAQKTNRTWTRKERAKERKKRFFNKKKEKRGTKTGTKKRWYTHTLRDTKAKIEKENDERDRDKKAREKQKERDGWNAISEYLCRIERRGVHTPHSLPEEKERKGDKIFIFLHTSPWTQRVVCRAKSIEEWKRKKRTAQPLLYRRTYTSRHTYVLCIYISLSIYICVNSLSLSLSMLILCRSIHSLVLE